MLTGGQSLFLLPRKKVTKHTNVFTLMYESMSGG